MFGDAAPEHHPAAPSTAKFCVQEIEKAGGVGHWSMGSVAACGELPLWENKDMEARGEIAAFWIAGEGMRYLWGTYGVLKPPQPFWCFPGAFPEVRGVFTLVLWVSPTAVMGALLWCPTGSEVALLL